MAVANNPYSRFVQFAKIALPLLALGLLSTMFLFSKSVDIEGAIPIFEGAEEIAREQSLAAPKFSGVTSDGSTITVTAESAKPDLTNPRRLSAKNVMADIETQGGTQFMVLSDDALYDGTTDTLDLMGRVRITTSTGYQLNTDALVADLAVTGLVSPGMVTGTGPAGTLEAGAMELSGENGSQVLVFKQGVKLIYDPKD
ncbi:hypothetical protein [uncultured Litoreibacter sp.]|uniref:hypothetical protein n=1 Tax=uncultured Litoreibacter sp. TaxID=1392394 RepID=UPI00262F8AFB|nr:hypothetical protein [uncultured Litoreibacter sp.]